MADTAPLPSRRTALRIGRPAVAAVIVALVAACAAPPPVPFAPTGLSVRLTQHAGTAITGPLSETTIATLDHDPEHAFALQGRAVLLEQFPRSETARLASQTTLLVTTPGSRPMLAVSRLGAGASRVPADEADGFLAALDSGVLGPNTPLGDVAGTLPMGVTAALRVSSTESGWLTNVALMLTRAADADGAEAPLTAALAFEGQVPERDDDRSTSLVRVADNAAAGAAGNTSAATAAAPQVTDKEEDARLVRQREGMYLGDGPIAGGAPLVVVVPLPQPGAPDAAVVLVLSLAPASSRDPAQHAADVAATFAAVAEATAAQRELASSLTDNEAYLRSMLAALASLDVAGRERAALVFLGSTSDAMLAEDLALVGDDATVAAYVALVQEEAAGLAASGESGTAIGWLLERSAYRLFTAAADEGRLSPTLSGLLLRHAGEVGRFPGTLDELVASCSDVAELRQRLRLENRQFLRDSNPVSRVRAYDWLVQQRAAPPGYDPLGPPAVRKAALDRAEEVEAAGTPLDAEAGPAGDAVEATGAAPATASSVAPESVR